jgi:hypothetical protein
MEERKYVNTSLEKAFTILELFDRENEKLMKKISSRGRRWKLCKKETG